MTVYFVLVSHHGQVVKREEVGSSAMAQQIAREWRAKGYSVRVTDRNNASYPY